MSVTLACSNNSCAARVELPEVHDEDRLVVEHVMSYDPVSGRARLVDAGPRVDITPAEGWTFDGFDEGWMCPRCTKEN